MARKKGKLTSPNENVLYVSNIYPAPGKYIYQYDLSASNIDSSKLVVNMYPNTGQLQSISYGNLKLGHDGKIYVPKGNGNGANSNTIYTHNLDVIQNPDIIGSGCNYISNYFNLGQGRITQALPNIPNFNLGALSGSICDSLSVGIEEHFLTEAIKVYPQPATVELNVVSEDRTMNRINLTDVQGKKCHEWQVNGKQARLLLHAVRAGMYIMNIETDREIFRKKVVIVK